MIYTDPNNFSTEYGFTPTPLGVREMYGLTPAQYLEEVGFLCCVICGRHPVDRHHCFCGRYSQKRLSDFDTIPLCDAHHQGRQDLSGIAIHKAKKTWIQNYGPDWTYIPQTRAKVLAAVGNRIGGR
jgi:hypothetical protein